MTKKQLIHIGTFNQPLGLKGEIKIIIHVSNFELFKSLSPYFSDDGLATWVFNHLHINKDKIIASLKNCNNRNCAEKLKGKKIFSYKNKLPKIKKNQFYISDLINCEVKTLKNNLLGKIINIANFGAGDLISIRKPNGENLYIPMNEENLINIDLKKRIVMVNPIKGILD